MCSSVAFSVFALLLQVNVKLNVVLCKDIEYRVTCVSIVVVVISKSGFERAYTYFFMSVCPSVRLSVCLSCFKLMCRYMLAFGYAKILL